jgi:dGTPase
LDDGLYAGLLTPGQLDGLTLWELGRREIGFKTESFDEMSRHGLIRRLIGILARDVCHATAMRIEQTGPQSVEELQRLPHNVIGFSQETDHMVRELKSFLYQNMYKHHRVVRMQKKAERFITQLFSAYMDDPHQLPDTTRGLDKTNGQTLARTICDYIAGMTDRYALQEYQKLFDPFTRP